LRPAGVRQQANRHDQHKLTGNTVLVVLMGLVYIPRSRGAHPGTHGLNGIAA
jgi:hypothetical protein